MLDLNTVSVFKSCEPDLTEASIYHMVGLPIQTNFANHFTITGIYM